MSGFPALNHDHGHCRADGLAAAEKLCEERGARLTPLRRQVLEVLLAQHRAMGAYDIAQEMGAQETKEATGSSKRAPAAMTVYRTLDFLMSMGLVHKLESLNAFIACAEPGEAHPVQFLICRQCGRVAELESEAITETVTRAAQKVGFEVDAPVIELTGRCPDCRQAART